MAATDFGALTDAVKKAWSAELWAAGRDQSFWFANGFVGKNEMDMNRPVYRVTKLTETERGLECVMQLVLDMQSDGVAGDNMLEGNEEALINDTQIIRIDQLRHGVRLKGQMSEQATVIRFRTTSKDKLSFWLPDKLDEMMFLVASGRAFTLLTNGATRGVSQLPQLTFANDVVAASTNRIVHAGAATSEATITAGDKMTWNFLVTILTKAARKRIKAIRDRGKNYWVVVMTEEQKRDLLTDTNYQTIVKDAAVRGSENPLFKNAMSVVHDLVLYSHPKVFNTLGLAGGSKWGAGGAVDGAQALLLGAQAVGFASIGEGRFTESDQTDHGNRPAIGFGRKIGMLKPQFKSIYDSSAREDFATISIKTAAAA